MNGWFYVFTKSIAKIINKIAILQTKYDWAIFATAKNAGKHVSIFHSLY
jgi:hypothetical protein